MNAQLATVQLMFEKMSIEGFPVNDQLKWGFYFLDNNSDNLNKVFDELRSHDYHLEELEEVADGEYQLYVSKIERLTPEKLHRRNVAFNELAAYCKVDSYEGWDVEKLP